MTNTPHIAVQYLSLFNWGRPPLPWDLADFISTTLAAQSINELGVGVTGSLCPSVLTAMAYGAPDRLVNAFAFKSQWSEGEGWNCVIEDSPGMENDTPWAKNYLPFKNIRFWDGASPFFHSEALFIDLPFSHECVQLKLDFLKPNKHRLLLLGFLQDHMGPDDVLEWAKQHGYQLQEHIAVIENIEQSKKLTYKLMIARK